MRRKLDREKWETGLVKKKGSERGGSECSASRRGRSWAESRWAIWGDRWVVTVRRPWSVLVKEGLLPGSTEGGL